MIVSRPLHTAAVDAPGEKMGAITQLGEWGAWRGALPGTGRSINGKEGIIKSGIPQYDVPWKTQF